LERDLWALLLPEEYTKSWKWLSLFSSSRLLRFILNSNLEAGKLNGKMEIHFTFLFFISIAIFIWTGLYQFYQFGYCTLLCIGKKCGVRKPWVLQEAKSSRPISLLEANCSDFY